MFLKAFYEKLFFEKKISRSHQKHKNYPVCKELKKTYLYVTSVFFIKFNRVKSGLSIDYSEGPQVVISPNNMGIVFLKIDFVSANRSC